MNSLDYLCHAAPAWVTISKRTNSKLHIVADAPKPSGASGRQYKLIVKALQFDCVQVSENTNKSILPKCCVERHINPDSTFCLHLNSTKPIGDHQVAVYWWQSLGEYLNNQDHASKFRKWPMYAQLSHGDAANIQLEMEALANSLGWREEVVTAIFREKGWLSGVLPRRTKSKRGLVNVRSACPRGCRQKHHPLRAQACRVIECLQGCTKLHKPILRVKCPHRTEVERLVLLEHERRAKDKEIFAHLRRSSFTCCGTMDNCPL